MRLSTIIISCCIGAACALAVGCGGRTVKVVDPNTSIHLSGRWNDDDSKSVSSKMIDSVLSHPWITDFRDRTGRKPRVRVSLIQNRSNEEIATDIFTNDLEKALINSGKVSFVASRGEAEVVREERGDTQANSTKESAPKSMQEQAADFVLQGAINVQHDSDAGKQVKFYQVDLRITDLTTNETVWTDGTERKKTVEE